MHMQVILDSSFARPRSAPICGGKKGEFRDWTTSSHIRIVMGRQGGLLVSALNSAASGPGSSPGWGHCVVFMGKTLNSHIAPLHPGVYIVYVIESAAYGVLFTSCLCQKPERARYERVRAFDTNE